MNSQYQAVKFQKRDNSVQIIALGSNEYLKMDMQKYLCQLVIFNCAFKISPATLVLLYCSVVKINQGKATCLSILDSLRGLMVLVIKGLFCGCQCAAQKQLCQEAIHNGHPE